LVKTRTTAKNSARAQNPTTYLVSGEPQVFLQECQLLLWRPLCCQEHSAAPDDTLERLPIDPQLLQRRDARAKHVVRLAAQRLGHLLRMRKSGSMGCHVSE
jgi:hypothetical protein